MTPRKTGAKPPGSSTKWGGGWLSGMKLKFPGRVNNCIKTISVFSIDDWRPIIILEQRIMEILAIMTSLVRCEVRR